MTLIPELREELREMVERKARRRRKALLALIKEVRAVVRALSRRVLP